MDKDLYIFHKYHSSNSLTFTNLRHLLSEALQGRFTIFDLARRGGKGGRAKKQVLQLRKRPPIVQARVFSYGCIDHYCFVMNVLDLAHDKLRRIHVKAPIV
jgi:hypothetical protein